MISRNQDTFITVGYSGNKKALDAFLRHKNFKHHMKCIFLHDQNAKKQQSMQILMNKKLKAEQEQKRK